MRLTGTAAIEYAETNRYLLNKYADPIGGCPRRTLAGRGAQDRIGRPGFDLDQCHQIRRPRLCVRGDRRTLPERLIPDCSEADRLPGRTAWNKKTRAEQIGWQYYPILMCTENLDEATAMAKSSGQTDYIVIQATKLSSPPRSRRASAACQHRQHLPGRLGCSEEQVDGDSPDSQATAVDHSLPCAWSHRPLRVSRASRVVPRAP